MKKFEYLAKDKKDIRQTVYVHACGLGVLREKLITKLEVKYACVDFFPAIVQLWDSMIESFTEDNTDAEMSLERRLDHICSIKHQEALCGHDIKNKYLYYMAMLMLIMAGGQELLMSNDEFSMLYTLLIKSITTGLESNGLDMTLYQDVIKYSFEKVSEEVGIVALPS